MKRSAVICCLLAGLACAAGEDLYTRSTYVMGTVAAVKLYASDEAAVQDQAARVFAEMRRLEDIFTNYRDSELTRLNRDAARTPVTLSGEMFELLRLSLEYSEKYHRAFDVTVGPAVRAWGFLGGPFRVPCADERRRLRQVVGADGLRFDSTRRTVSFRRPGMELDFGGIAKGYAAEKAARLLARLGVRRALVNLGDSSFFALGPPPGRRGWPVAVLDPRPPHAPAAVLELPPFHALSTSGTYGRSFREAGALYTHLFDPRTAEPVSLEASATVICRSGAESEAASKAVLLLAPAQLAAFKDIEWLRLEVRSGRRGAALLVSSNSDR